jgi:hypothetical protein
VFEQCLLCAAVQNMKKIALVVDRDDLLRLLRLMRRFVFSETLCKKFEELVSSVMADTRQLVLTTE